ncbi:MAG: hypothetical protein COY72_00645 [Candidatus Nealsonbacteria bacterium CG_4_10_14_0_8_um_filter_35_10]|uniref:Uncharacterized protein n=2 Tax=Candidatus Nealsoniibacteriota TaxID=1817911 RepID=A0A2M7R8R6_9BACT|nr:MAG: hypothetical protein AUJ24_01305 [Parcubacteria group bacterium CG1_02_36_42]PIY90988.1 MAG: hypothetical protein COY72_00645 [Candidatus Nealsonbacteria bacterium CG_4_10_14_0_8_um_filter_35_10]PJB99367.1 MAG: hypothetical protein CO077_02100 [Candidatus Nealsonbacteria bacterium CG_4_9_14_0_8_um_filter_35_12]
MTKFSIKFNLKEEGKIWLKFVGVANLLLEEIAARSIISRIEDENKKLKFPGALEECEEKRNSTFLILKRLRAFFI